MKIQLRILILLAAVMVGSGNVWGEYYALANQGSSSITLMNGWSVASDKEYTLSAPGKTLSFQVEKTAKGALGNITVKAGDITVKTIDVTSFSKDSWQSYTVNLPDFNNYKTNRKITFSAGGTLAKYLRNAQVTMAQYIENPSSTADMAWGAGKVDDANVTKSVTIAWCNVPAITTSVSGTGSDKVSVSIENNSSAGKYGTATVKVTYNRNAASTLNATLTISNTYGSYSKSIKLTGSTTKYDQTLTWANGINVNMVVGTTQNISATSTSGLTPSYTSNNSTYLSVDATGKLTANKVGANITITASQAGNYKYNAATSITKVFQVKNKLTPTFVLNGDETLSAATLYVGQSATVVCTNVDANLNVTPDKSGMVNIAKSNYTYTITALQAGSVDVTFDQHSTDVLADGKKIFTFTILGNPTNLAFQNVGTTMTVGQEIANPYTSLNSATPTFSCTPEGSVVFENGKLVAKTPASATLSFSQAKTDYYAAAAVEKTVQVTLNDPNFQWNVPSSCNWNQSYSSVASSNNTETPLTITANNKNIADYVNGKIVVYNTDGTASFTIQQAATSYYAGINTNKTITVSRAANHVPFTIDKTLYDNLKGATSGEQAWDGGIKLGTTSGMSCAFDWSDKYRVFGPFVGIGNMLTANYTCSDAATDRQWIIQESADGSSWTDAMNTTSAGNANVQLKPSTKYIKFVWSGNYAGYFQNVTITERKEIAASDMDFGQAYIGDNATNQNISVDWYNVGPITVTSNSAQFEVQTPTINSALDQYAKGVPVTISYKHDVSGSHTGTITFTAATGETKSVKVTGTTNKLQQTITWKANLSPMPMGIDVTDAATATSQEQVTFTSDNTDVIQVIDGTTLRSVGPGTVHITATQAGTSQHAAVNDVKEIEVTNKEVQYITWDDNLSNVKFTGTTFTKTLTATTTSSLPLTWSVDPSGSSIASIEGNVLTIKGLGTTYVTVSQAGNDTYVAVAATKKLVVRDPASGCNPLVANQSSEYSIFTINSAEYNLSGEPEFLTIQAKKQSLAIGEIKIAQYVNGSYQQVAALGEGSSYANYGPYTLNRKATKVKVYTETGATLYHYFNNLEVTLAKYLESSYAQDGLDFSNTPVNSYVEKTLPISYSNINGVLDVTIENSTSGRFSVDKTTIGEDCGDAGTTNLTVRYTANQLVDNETATVHITNGTQTLDIPLKGSAMKQNQQITWNNTSYDAYTTDDVALSASTNAVDLQVSFSTNDATIAEVSSDNHLLIHKAGSVSITASQAGNDVYNAAPSVSKTFTIVAVTPTITTLPTTAATYMAESLTLESIALTGGEGSVAGTFAWKNPTTAIVAAGTETYPVVFTPTNTDYYTTTECQVSVTVVKHNQSITWDMPDAQERYCYELVQLTASASSELPVTFEVDDETKVIINANLSLQVLKAGTVTITAKQAGNLYWNAAESISKTITFKQATPVITTAPTCKRIRHGEYLNDTYLQGGVAMFGEEEVPGNFHWNDSKLPQAEEKGYIMSEGTYWYNADFIPANAEWFASVGGNVRVVVRPSVFETKDTTTSQPVEWSEHNNWKIGSAPIDDDDRVKVNTDVVITTDVTLEGLTISANKNVYVKENASLTITGSNPVDLTATGYGNLIVEAGGKVSVAPAGELLVKDFVLESKMSTNGTANASSGQILNPEGIQYSGDVYFDVQLDESGEASFGWYAFAVPFEVSLNEGIFFGDKLLKSEKDFGLMQYQGDVRAQGEYGWIKTFKKTKTLYPGVFYLITLADTDYATLRLRKTSGSAIQTLSEMTLNPFVSGQVTDAGWNGVANPNMVYTNVQFSGGEKVQIYSHENNAFSPQLLSETSFVVGAPFFAQYATGSQMSFTLATNEILRAPERNLKTNDEFCVRLGRNTSSYVDQLFLSADEDATTTYQAGRELVKISMGTASAAQMGIDAYGATLCDANFPLMNGEAEFPLTLSAPKQGAYTIYMHNGPANQELYLTYNGTVIWNFANGAYDMDLTKGNTSGYALKVVANRKVTTNISDNPVRDGVNVHKQIIHQHLYIIRDGIQYDATGKKIQ